MAIIDNKSQTMHEALVNALTSAEKVDIGAAFFYFSGWHLLAKHLKDKKIRILVGKYIDPDAIPELLTKKKQDGEDVDLEPFQSRKTIPSRVGKKQTYIESFIRLSNESALLDDSDNQNTYKILESKIADGSLEIKLTSSPEHGKMYICHNKPELSQNGDYPGTVFMGSSNFTYQGLINQGELNERHSDKESYTTYMKQFENLWSDSKNIDIATLENKDDLLKQFKDELWVHATPSPYAVYIRVLHELFGKEDIESMKTPGQITKNKYFDLEYQVDAISSVLDKLNKYDGVILADVVGLGKSIIASAAAYNSRFKTIIIAPPHLREQWEDYQEEFRLPGARVFSSGAVDEVYDKYKNNDQPLLIIVDEAHRYRNEDTDDYRMLHHICASHPENKVMLLTATPFNNNPKDVFALIKLFQIPGQSTIRSVDNLSLRFRDIIERYKKLNRDRRSGKADQAQIDKEADEISIELRRLIENVIIRRSRLDLQVITRYKEDLKKQHIDFAEVEGPQLLTYDLGNLADLYFDTLSKLTEPEEEKGGFIGARYKPADYIKNKKEFLKSYGKDLKETDLKTAQTNLANFMKRLLVMRFESSKDAFRSTLQNMIASTEMIEDWWNKLGKVPIMKKGQIPDPEMILSTSDDNIIKEINQQNSEAEIEKLKESKGLVAVDKALIEIKFINDVIKDKILLTQIYNDWFGPKAGSIKESDPKLDKVKKQIDILLSKNPKRKIVVFSSYADTIDYLSEEFSKRGLKRVLKYTGAAGRRMKKTVRANFDAGITKADQKNDYDVLVTTDALSEGCNLHRAGVVINYDIPYNPTRVIQRIGRINRINKKVFDKLSIYNFFPTKTGESEIKIHQIATLKMRLINAVVGSDTKTLTSDEKLQTFFKDEYQEAEKQNEVLSWDAIHHEAYNQAKKDKEAFNEALKIKPRSRVIRDGQKEPAVVAFGKKGEHAVFVLKKSEAPSVVAAEVALRYFKAEKEEKGKEADKQYDEVFKLIRNLLFEKHPLPSITGRRAESLKIIKVIEEKLPTAKDYCHDLAQIIKKYDGINEGDLKLIAQLSVENLEEAFAELKKIVPQHQIYSINERASRLEGEYETIVLSEDIRP